MTNPTLQWNFERYAANGFPQEKSFEHQTTFRVNTLYFEDKQVVNALRGRGAIITKITFIHHAYIFESDFPLASSIEYLSGALYIQETSAQIPAEIISKFIYTNKLDVSKLQVLDMCAAPGGKTVQLAQIMENKGTLIANDSSKERAQKLLYNIERMQVGNCDVTTNNGEDIQGEFDIILLDAPCSGNFTQSSNWSRSEEDLLDRQTLQQKLISHAITILKPGGLLVYSTCSLEKEEDEDIVSFAIKKGLTILPTHIKIGHPGLTEETKNCIRIWPTQDRLPGFFVAALQKPL
jgi:NOL1/NOP2/sun family putative RNA methylase